MRLPAAVLVLAALAAPAGAAGQAKVTLAIDTRVVPDPLPAGGHGEVRLTLGVPEGVVLNRFPGITFTPEATPGLAFDEDRAFLGLKKLAKDPAEAYFEAIDPLVLGFSVAHEASGTLTVRGELKYFYCVKKSGYCAPGKQQVSVSVPVGSSGP